MRLPIAAPFVLSIALFTASSPPGVGPQLESRLADAMAEGRGVLRTLVESRRTPGAAAAAVVNGRLVWSEGAGLADLEHDVPAAAETRFGIGSVSKTLTMAAAVRLWERGVVDLDAPIERYLPDFPHRGRGITIRRIAAHQSGISDRFAADHYTTARHFDTLDEAYREIARAPLEYEPGTRTVYATGVFTIVGRALEAAAGRDYRTLMREEVFAPAGALDIVPNDRAAIVPRRSGFYVVAGSGGFENGPFFDPSFKLPGAGYLATAPGLARVGASLLRSRLLTDRGRAEMFRTVPLADRTATPYALGLQAGDDPAFRYLMGGGIGISSFLGVHADADLVIVLLANASGAIDRSVYQRMAAPFLRALDG